jgi:hypothetical protein
MKKKTPWLPTSDAVPTKEQEDDQDQINALLVDRDMMM